MNIMQKQTNQVKPVKPVNKAATVAKANTSAVKPAAKTCVKPCSKPATKTVTAAKTVQPAKAAKTANPAKFVKPAVKVVKKPTVKSTAKTAIKPSTKFNASSLSGRTVLSHKAKKTSTTGAKKPTGTNKKTDNALSGVKSELKESAFNFIISTVAKIVISLLGGSISSALSASGAEEECGGTCEGRGTAASACSCGTGKGKCSSQCNHDEVTGDSLGFIRKVIGLPTGVLTIEVRDTECGLESSDTEPQSQHERIYNDIYEILKAKADCE